LTEAGREAFLRYLDAIGALVDARQGPAVG
jgi:hypothetical protein